MSDGEGAPVTELPTPQDAERAADFMRAAELARRYLETEVPPERASPFRMFVMGYLAAIKDRA